MTSKRIGELLSQMVPLSHHDVEEILQEQLVTRKPFGSIALAHGLCRPEHVWKAWCGQLLDGQPRHVDLETFGIDTQALCSLSPETARALRIVPIRVFGEVIIIAAAEPLDESRAASVAALLAATSGRKQVRFVTANAAQVSRAIEVHYPLLHAVG